MSDFEIIKRMFCAVLCGGIVGFERQIRNRHAGIRTYMIISLVGCVFPMIVFLCNPENVATVVYGVCVGIGFIGAGVIFKKEQTETIYGLTTAASLWITVGIGVCFGIGKYFLGLVLTIMVMFILTLVRWVELKLGLKK